MDTMGNLPAASKRSRNPEGPVPSRRTSTLSAYTFPRKQLRGITGALGEARNEQDMDLMPREATGPAQSSHPSHLLGILEAVSTVDVHSFYSCSMGYLKRS